MARNAVLVSAAGDEQDLALLDLLIEWSRSGWLQPFVWVAPEVSTGTTASLMATVPGSAWHVMHGTRMETSVGSYIADGDFDEFRVLCVQLLGANGTPTFAHENGLLLGRRLQEAVFGLPQRLVRIALIVPTSEIRPIEASMFFDDWDVNLIISPEDRRDPLGADGEVWGDRALVSQAALALATTGGLWTGCEAPEFHRQDRPDEDVHLRLARPFGRLVQGTVMVDDIIRDLLPSHGALPTGGGVRAIDDGQLVGASLYELTARAGGPDGGILHRIPEEFEEGQPQDVGFFASFLEMLSGTAARFIDRRLEFLDRLEKRLNRRANKITYGGEWKDRRMRKRATLRARNKRTVMEPVESPPSSATPFAPPLEGSASISTGSAADRRPQRVSGGAILVPQFWSDLRLTFLSLVDGGDFPAGMERPRTNLPLVVNDRATLLPLPEIQGLTLRSALPQEVQSAVALLWTDAPMSLDDSFPYADPLAMRLIREWIEALSGDLQPRYLEASASSGGEEEAHSLALALDGLARLGEMASAHVQERETSLLWRVAEQITFSIEEADEAQKLAEADEERASRQEATQPKKSKLLRLLRWVRRGFFVLTVMTALLPIALHFLKGKTEWVEGLPLVGALLSPLVAASFSAGFQAIFWLLWRAGALYLGSWVITELLESRRAWQLENLRDTAAELKAYAVQVRLFEEGELRRLKDLYDRLLDWGVALGWLIHQPVNVKSIAATSVETQTIPERPRALRVVEGHASPERVRMSARECGEEMLPKGWLTALFDEYEKQFVITDGRLTKLDLSPTGRTVREFTRLLADGSLSEPWVDAARRRVVSKLVNLRPGELFDDVRELAGQGSVRSDEDPPVDAGSFLEEIYARDESGTIVATPLGAWTRNVLSIATKNERRDKVLETILWIPKALGRSSLSGERLGAREVILSSSSWESLDRSLVMLSARLDLTDALLPRDIGIQEPGSAEDEGGSLTPPETV